MNFVTSETKIHAIRQGEQEFTLNDGFITYPRAMLHITPDCPATIRQHIEWAVSEGYLKTVAHVTEREMLFIGLTK